MREFIPYGYPSSPCALILILPSRTPISPSYYSVLPLPRLYPSQQANCFENASLSEAGLTAGEDLARLSRLRLSYLTEMEAVAESEEEKTLDQMIWEVKTSVELELAFA